MNGITSNQMTKSGIVYKKNYGVGIPRIKEIANNYPPNHLLSQHLWNLSIRETMIMATLLANRADFTPDLAKQWMLKFNQIEIIEQACMHLFSKLPYAPTLSCECLESEDEWRKTTGFILAARIYKHLKESQLHYIIQKGVQNASTDHFQLYKSVALCLSRLCRLDANIAQIIWEQIAGFKESPCHAQRYIYHEVEQELIFLDRL